MSANEDFFRSRKAAAVLKHGILKRYPVVFAASTGKRNPVVFLDGYAGRGEYDQGEPGSPLLLSRCAEFVSGYRDVRGFFVEQDPANFANLSQVLEAKGGRTPRTLRHGSLDEHLAEALAMSAEASLFAFLDPFGPALDFEKIKYRLLGRPKWPPTEVLLHFSVLAIARMGRAVHVARQRNQIFGDTEDQNAERLNRFLGGTWWQDFFADIKDERDEETATQVALRVGAEYEARLTAGTRYRAIRMPIRPRPDLAPKYVLILFAAHPDGAWAFADALGKAGVEWERAWFEEQLRRGEVEAPTLFADTPVFDADRYEKSHAPRWSAAIERNIDRLLELGPFRPAERVPDVYGPVLGHAWTPHARQAVKELHRKGLVDHPGKGDFWKETLHRP